ncbi:MAG: GHKL domain-containing protein [Oscillospiraceae bacterium]|jgi:two-component system sensor histidine kinase AgrC|nr:GHKL domain-containing protein [Oscillospiraceae bacterium]
MGSVYSVMIFIINIAMGYMQILVGVQCTECQWTRLKVLIASIAVLSFYSIGYYFISHWVIVPVYIFLFASMLFLIMKIAFSKGLIISVFIYVISMTFDFIFLTILHKFVPDALQTQVMTQTTLPAFISKIIIFFLWGVVLFVVRKLREKIRYFMDNNAVVIAVGPQIAFLFLFIYPNYSHFFDMFLSHTEPLNIYNTVLLFFFIIYSIFNVARLSNYASKETDHKVRLQYFESREKAHFILRSFKHDLRNIINAINGYLKMDEITQLKSYMQGISSDLWMVNTIDTLNLDYKKIPDLYGILLAKNQEANASDIKFDTFFQLKEQFKSKISPADLNRVVGILLDNALESAALSAKKYIWVYIEQNMGLPTIEIKNSCSQDVDIDLITKEGYTSKTEHHGIGLHEIEVIMKKYYKKKLNVGIRYENSKGEFIATLFA